MNLAPTVEISDYTRRPLTSSAGAYSFSLDPVVDLSFQRFHGLFQPGAVVRVDASTSASLNDGVAAYYTPYN
jgi:hypothetical protein